MCLTKDTQKNVHGRAFITAPNCKCLSTVGWVNTLYILFVLFYLGLFILLLSIQFNNVLVNVQIRVKQPSAQLNQSLSLQICHFWTFHPHGITQRVALYVWLLSRSLVFQRFIQAGISTLFLFMGGQYSIVWAYYILFIHLSISRHLVVSTFCYYESCGYEYSYLSLCVDKCFHFSWVNVPRSAIAGSCKNVMLYFLRNCQTFSKWMHHFAFPASIYERSSFILANTCYCVCFYYSHFYGMKQYNIVFYISLMTENVEHFIMCSLEVHMLSLVKYLFSYLAYF